MSIKNAKKKASDTLDAVVIPAGKASKDITPRQAVGVIALTAGIVGAILGWTFS